MYIMIDISRVIDAKPFSSSAIPRYSMTPLDYLPREIFAIASALMKA